MKPLQLKTDKKITTNLLNIIEAVEEELNESERKLAPSIVTHMINNGKIKLTCETKSCRFLFH
jgi:hypothetical protein